MNPLGLNGGRISGTDDNTAADLAISHGHSGVLASHGFTNHASHKVNGRIPKITNTIIRGIPRNLTRCNHPTLPRSTNPYCVQNGRRGPYGYVEGEIITVQVTFSEPVTFSRVARLAINLESGTVYTDSWSSSNNRSVYQSFPLERN